MFASSGSSIKFWDETNLEVLQDFNNSSGSIPAISWNKDGQILSAVDQNTSEVSLYTVDSQSAICSGIFKALNSVTCLEFCKTNSRFLAIGDSEDQILIWDVKGNTKKKSYSVPKTLITSLSFSPLDSHLAVGTVNGDAYTISNTNNLISRPIKIFSEKTEVKDIRYSILNRSLVGVCGENGTVAMFDSNTNKVFARYTPHSAPVSNLVFSPISELLMISVGYDKKLISYDINSKSIVLKYEMDDPLTCISFIKNGQSVVVGTMTGEVITYDLRMLSHYLCKSIAYKGPVHDLKFQPGTIVDKLKWPKKKSKNIISSENKAEATCQDKSRLKIGEEFTLTQRTESSSTPFEILSPMNSRVSYEKELSKNVPLLKNMKTPAKTIKHAKDIDELGLLSPIDKENRSPIGKLLASAKPLIMEGILSPIEGSPISNASSSGRKNSGSSVSKSIHNLEKIVPDIVDDMLLSPLKTNTDETKVNSPNKLPSNSTDQTKVNSSKNLASNFKVQKQGDSATKSTPVSSVEKVKRKLLKDERTPSPSASDSLPHIENSLNKTEDEKFEEAIRLAFPSELGAVDGLSTLHVSKKSETENEDNSSNVSPSTLGNWSIQHSFSGGPVEEIKSKYASSNLNSEIRRHIAEILEDHDFKMKKRLMNLHVSFIKQIIGLKSDMKQFIKELSINEELLLENERLKEEILKLKCTY